MFSLANNIPIVNYILHILDDISYYMSNTVEHIILLNEVLKVQEEVKVEESVFEALEKIYLAYGNNLNSLEQVESMVGDNRDTYFVMNLTDKTLQLLQNISNQQVNFINLLGDIEQASFKSLILLMINHITIEERYSLEILSKHISGIQSFGFWGN